MSTTIVRYQVTPESVADNERLVRAVYAELTALAPVGFRYATFRLDDGVSFMHVAVTAGEADAPLPKLDAFRAFLADLRERCDVPPQAARAEVVGAYPFLVAGATRAGASAT